MGVCLFVMTAGKFPFSEATDTSAQFRALQKGELKYPAHFSTELKDLLDQMWRIVPEERITIPEVALSPFVGVC